MFLRLFLLLSLNLISGLPLESESQLDLKSFLSPRIIGGIDAPPEYGKHMAALVYGETTPFLMCGGSIISKHHILSAAHCIEPMVIWGELLPSFRAVVGSHKWASTKNNIKFTGYINHPGYSWETLKNDIGILFLANPIKLNHNTAIIPLRFDWVYGGTETYVNGWGIHETTQMLIPDTLQLLYKYVISPWHCAEGLLQAAGGSPSPPYDPKVEICTFHSFGHGMCFGDSGSALVEVSTQKQIGIVSWGFPCARGAPDVFVRCSAFKEFILENVGFEL